MDTIPAVISGGAIIIAAVIALFGALYGHLSSRLGALEDDLEAERAYNRKMWGWARSHVDLYYRYRRDGAPDPAPIPVPGDPD